MEHLDIVWTANLRSMTLALGIGLLIGIERERRKGNSDVRAAAGVRSFVLIALIGCACQLLASNVLLALAGCHVIALAAFSYARTREADPGITTELAMFWTLVLGAMAPSQPSLASALAVISTLILLLRQDIHHFSTTLLTTVELRSALLLLASILIVLPLLPSTPIDPWGSLSLRKIWLLTIMLMLISGVSHVALRAGGQRYGLLITGLASGFVSGTATFASMAALAKANPERINHCVGAAVISCAAGITQAALIVLAVHPSLLHRIWPSLAIAAVTAVILSWRQMHVQSTQVDQSQVSTESPFRVKTMLVMIVVLSGATVLSAALAQHFGERSLMLAITSISVIDSHPAIASVANLAMQSRLSESSAGFLVQLALSASLLGKLFIARIGGWAFVSKLLLPCALIIAMLWSPYWFAILRVSN